MRGRNAIHERLPFRVVLLRTQLEDRPAAETVADGADALVIFAELACSVEHGAAALLLAVAFDEPLVEAFPLPTSEDIARDDFAAEAYVGFRECLVYAVSTLRQSNLQIWKHNSRSYLLRKEV